MAVSEPGEYDGLTPVSAPATATFVPPFKNGWGTGRFSLGASCSIHSPRGPVVAGTELVPSVYSPVAYIGGPGVGKPSLLVPA